ncbi:MAG TPA: DUF4388 domain-containing protein [Nitrospiria bacterium]
MGFTGKIEDIPILDIIQYLNAGNKTGTLILTQKEEKAYVYFQGGNIVHALAPHLINIGDLLLNTKAITLKDLQNALVLQNGEKKGTRIGQILVGMGVITSEQLRENMITQIKTAIGHLVQWKEGDFNFENNEIVSVDDINLNPTEGITESKLSTQSLLMDALSIGDEGGEEDARGQDLGAVSRESAPPSPGNQADEAAPQARTPLPDSVKAPQEIYSDPLKDALREVNDVSSETKDLKSPAAEQVKTQPVETREAREETPREKQTSPVVFFTEDGVFKNLMRNALDTYGFHISFPGTIEESLEKVKKSLKLGSEPILYVEEGTASGASAKRSPGMRALKEKDREKWRFPVVVLLNEKKQDQVWEFYSAGARAVLPKPVREGAENEHYIRSIKKLGELILKKTLELQDEIAGQEV